MTVAIFLKNKPKYSDLEYCSRESKSNFVTTLLLNDHPLL